MSIPKKILEAVSEKPRGTAKSKSARLDKAAGLVADFAQERSLGALEAMLAAAEKADSGSEDCPKATEVLQFRRDAAEISEQTQVLQSETERFLRTHTR